MQTHDVLVVGAGPAGAVTALYAARAGLDVALVDKRVFPRDKICGDAVARKSLAILRELGLLGSVKLATHEPIARAVLSSPGGHEVAVDLSEPDDPAPHLVCRRELFDHVLFEAARRETTAIEGATVTEVWHREGELGTVLLRAGGRTERIRARVIVGADGFDSIVARRLGLYRHDSRRWFVATRGYYRGLDVAPGTVEVHFLGETLPGFLWVFPTGDGIANVGLGLVHRDLKRRRLRLRDVHDEVVGSSRLRRRFARAERMGPVAGWNLPTPDRRRVLGADRVVLVGDAAGLVDPFSGEGIGNALVSARAAAHTIAAAMGDGRPSRVHDEYRRRLEEEIDFREIALHYRLRALARRGRVIDFILGRAAAHPDVLQWLRAMTSARDTTASKLALLSPLTYARLWLRG